MRNSEGDQHLGRMASDVDALKVDAARARPHESRDRPKERRLARAVRADQRHNLGGADLEANAAQSPNRAVAHLKPLHVCPEVRLDYPGIAKPSSLDLKPGFLAIPCD